MTVPAAHKWATNAELIEDVARLHLNRGMIAADVTYGRGLWWTRWRPDDLIEHDLKLDGVDFRKLPEGDGWFHLVAFDPPYVCVGGRKTSTLPDFMDRYGMADTPMTPAALQAHNDEGLAEVYRVLQPKGLALVKCQDYVSSGKLWPGSHFTLCAALALGFELVDRFEHLTTGRAQPAGRTRKAKPGEEAPDETGRIPSRQHHARYRPSTLFVLRRKRR